MAFSTYPHANAYGQNLRGFNAFVPNAFGADPAQMERYYNQIYIYGPDPRFPISAAMIAGAAAFKAVRTYQDQSGMKLPNNHDYNINAIRTIAAREADMLLRQFPLPDVDPTIILLSAEAGAHRLYDQEHYIPS
ncbi:5634_t:CDS:2 [Paraglomus brasilianum]|uniref:5634_t:CDS:1 n=1 Tax=Paraglomus brasilianum TaxID=144538 RepID=A0A9N8ZB89_9GLOM|nr:5634_t:CDS:2 [Paraglomus brasilianum]